jgi:hypothetical protein
MAREGTLAVEGYSQLLRATARADKEQKRATRKILEQAGESVRRDAQSFFSPINSRTAAGFKTRVRAREIVVGQSMRKTTGKHPEYGRFQMRVLVRARTLHEDEMMRDLERAFDQVADHFNKRP